MKTLSVNGKQIVVKDVKTGKMKIYPNTPIGMANAQADFDDKTKFEPVMKCEEGEKK